MRGFLAGMSLIILAGMSVTHTATAQPKKAVLGYIENVYVGELALGMSAKLDTGADFSSVFAREIDTYRNRDRERWVRFQLVGDDGRTINYNKKVIRTAYIKTKTGGNVERPVVTLRVCVNGISAVTPVNLADRSDFDHPFLIGREFLAPRIIVDSSQSYMAEEPCGSTSDESEDNTK